LPVLNDAADASYTTSVTTSATAAASRKSAAGVRTAVDEARQPLEDVFLHRDVLGGEF